MEDIVNRSTDTSSRLWLLTLDLLEKLATWAVTSGLRIVLIVVLAWGLWMVLNRATLRLRDFFVGDGGESHERKKRADTLSSIVRTVAAILLGVAAIMMILRETGIDIAPILATAGIGGLAIGFGAQSLVKDVISGFFFLVEDQVRIGDVVEVAGRSGSVEGMGLRTIRLRALNGNVHVIPNGGIDVITNMTKDFSHYVLEVGIAYREDPDEVFDILRAIDEEMRTDPQFGPSFLRPIEVFGVDSFGESAVTVKARLTTRPMLQWSVGREFNRRLKKRFDERNIEIPFPHVTLYMGQDKSGSAPPLRVAAG